MGHPHDWEPGSPSSPRAPGRMSPRTERVMALNDTYRGFLAQLDADFTAKQSEWESRKGVLEDKLAKLQTVGNMSRWLMRKVLRKMQVSHGLGLVTLIFYSWCKIMARRRSARRAHKATQHMFRQQNKQLVKMCFLAMQHAVSNMKVGCRLLCVSSADDSRASGGKGPMSSNDAAFAQHVIALWRIGTQISALADDGNEDEGGFLEDLDEPAPNVALAGLAIAPKDGNSVFIRRQLIFGWRKLVHRKKARQAFMATQSKPASAFMLRWDQEDDFHLPGDIAHHGVGVQRAGMGVALLRGDFRLDLYFSLWRYNVVKAISLWRSAYRMVEFRERGLLGKVFSLWNRTVWMAQSQSYWKNELDHSIAQIEEQRVAWEERVEELESELGRYMPHFGSRVLARPAKETTTWEAFISGVEGPAVDKKKMRKEMHRG